MEVQKLPKGETIRLFSRPPDGFRPIEADDRELRLYGFPRRPTENPELLKRWQRTFDRKLQVIRPVFRTMDYRRRRRPGVEPFKFGHEPYESLIWSGGIVSPQPGSTMRWVSGEWTVPNVYLPSNATSFVWYSASSWIGIDGYHGSVDCLQAGVDSDVIGGEPFGGAIRLLSPWWEWFPGDTHWISNFPVSQGDTMSCVICVDPGSAVAAEIYLMNLTNGAHTSFAVTAPKEWSLAGDSAEWIVEALALDTYEPALASYGSVYFDGCIASDSNQNLIQVGDGNPMNMTDFNGNLISRGDILAPQLVRCLYERFPSSA